MCDVHLVVDLPSRPGRTGFASDARHRVQGRGGVPKWLRSSPPEPAITGLTGLMHGVSLIGARSCSPGSDDVPRDRTFGWLNDHRRPDPRSPVRPLDRSRRGGGAARCRSRHYMQVRSGASPRVPGASRLPRRPPPSQALIGSAPRRSRPNTRISDSSEHRHRQDGDEPGEGQPEADRQARAWYGQPATRPTSSRAPEAAA